MNKNYKVAKIFSLIPIVAVLTLFILMLFAIICEEVLHIHTGFLAGPLLVVILVVLFGGFYFLIFSVLGIVFSIKSIKQNNKGIVFLIFSIIDIFISVGLLYASYYMIFIAGPSV